MELGAAQCKTNFPTLLLVVQTLDHCRRQGLLQDQFYPPAQFLRLPNVFLDGLPSLLRESEDLVGLVVIDVVSNVGLSREFVEKSLLDRLPAAAVLLRQPLPLPCLLEIGFQILTKEP
jgi:hypothetical protein